MLASPRRAGLRSRTANTMYINLFLLYIYCIPIYIYFISITDYGRYSALNTVVPLYVPVAVPATTVSPQKVAR